MLKQHAYSPASMVMVCMAGLGLTRSQSRLEGSCAWDGLRVVTPASLTIQVKMSTCAQIQLGCKHSKLESLGETEQ